MIMEKVKCEICGKEVAKTALHLHMRVHQRTQENDVEEEIENEERGGDEKMNVEKEVRRSNDAMIKFIPLSNTWRAIRINEGRIDVMSVFGVITKINQNPSLCVDAKTLAIDGRGKIHVIDGNEEIYICSARNCRKVVKQLKKRIGQNQPSILTKLKNVLANRKKRREKVLAQSDAASNLPPELLNELMITLKKFSEQKEKEEEREKVERTVIKKIYE